MITSLYGFISISIIATISVIVLFQTEPYYLFCREALEREKVINTSIEEFVHVCKKNYKNYNNHFLINNTVNLIYDKAKENVLIPMLPNAVKKEEMKADTQVLEYNLKVHKYYAIYKFRLYVC